MANNSALLENILHMDDDESVGSNPELAHGTEGIEMVNQNGYHEDFGAEDPGERITGNGLADAKVSSGEMDERNLVEMFQNLIQISSRLRNGIEHAIQKDQAVKAKKAEQEDASDSEEEEEEEEEEDQAKEPKDSEDEDEDEDEEIGDNERVDAKTPSKKLSGERKSAKPKTELESLLVALHLHKRQKQNLLIKKALLLKFEEALFGNNNITMTLDLRTLGEEEKDGKLEEILQCKDLSHYLPKSITENGNSMEFADKASLRETVTAAKSPPDILNRFRPKTPKKIAINLIKQQYNIRWNTKGGEYKPFDFYELPKQFMKGIVRKMHMQTVLYEHRSDILHMEKRLNPSGPLTNVDVVPKLVYVKKDPYRRDPDAADEDVPVRLRDEPKFSWQSWDLGTGESTDRGFDFPPELKWIDPKVKILIKKLTTPIADDFDTEKMENVMYLVVVNDTSSKLLLESGGNCSQIYIGAADNGLKSRFLDADDCHGNRIRQLHEHYQAMESFNPDSSALLVELRMLLALARREPSAVFALQVFDSPRTLGREVHDLVIKALYLANNEIWGPAVNMKFGLNVKEELKKRRRFLPDHFPGKNRKKK